VVFAGSGSRASTVWGAHRGVDADLGQMLDKFEDFRNSICSDTLANSTVQLR